MIAARLTGGLGNQMFQYAAGRSLAAECGTQLVLDSRWFGGLGSGIPGAVRQYLLGCFALDADLVDVSKIAVLPPRSRSEYWLQRIVPARARPALGLLVEDEQSGPDPRFFDSPDDTYLDGFWHSERYFEAHADLIRLDFTFTALATGRNAELSAEIEEATSVSIHVRRGDYVTEPKTRAVAGTLGSTWYRAAVELIAERVGPVTVYVFSDEPEWCRANLAFDRPTVVIDGNGTHGGFEDMRLMSLCRHHVIANSTFSWWGAWLDPRPDKIVVAPQPWRMNQTGTHVCPDGWIKLSR